MSTRGAVGRITSKPGEAITFSGIFSHWNNYPDGAGKALFNLYKKAFKRDTNAMLKYLIDDHPAGWSTINGDPNVLPTQCYCHGNRKEEGRVITEKNASKCGCEYVYAFTPDGKTMLILSSYCEDGSKMIGMFGCGDPKAEWKVIGELKLNGAAPKNWETYPLINAPSKSKKVVEKV